jgi:hypothetical protein
VLAEQAGLMTVSIKKIVQVTPRKAVTWIPSLPSRSA